VTAALALLGYAVAAGCLAPVLLTPLTKRGASVRPGLVAWLSAMVSVPVSAALGAALIAETAEADWPALTRLLCQQVAGTACSPQVYRNGLYSAGVAVLAVLSALALLAALWRYGRRLQRAVASTRLHARAALLAGRELAGAGTVVIDDPRPVAYCVAGRPAAIVVSSGALAVLDEPQLAAVLAHERAHLAGRHHLLAALTRSLAAVFPGVPLFASGSVEVARLAELAADDMAARSAGRPAVVAALLAIATGTAVPGATAPGAGAVPRGALAASGHAVPARVERLLDPPAPAAAAMFGLALALASAAFLLAPGLLAAVAA
jgi:Zn-dependent protease with chaperone function